MKKHIVEYILIVLLSLGFVGLVHADSAVSIEGGNLIVNDSNSDVVVTCLGKSAGYTHSLYLDNTDTFLFESSEENKEVNLGKFPLGVELIFKLEVSNGKSYFTGAAERNSDNVIHVKIEELESDTWWFGFEDIYGGGDADYNDCMFQVSGVKGSENPPAILLMPSTHDFGMIDTGSNSQSKSFNVSNIGQVPLIIDTLLISGNDFDEFIIQNDTCSGQSLEESQSCNVEVLFSPQSLGVKSAVISIPSNDPEFPIYEILIKGSGQDNLSEECTQETLNAQYEAGKQYCIDNPEACGIFVSEGCTQAELNTEYQSGYNAGCSACSDGSTTPATLSAGLDMHIPVLQYETLLGTMNLWADFELAGESNGDMLWKLSDFGQDNSNL